MTKPITFKIDPKLDLVLERIVDLSPEQIWKTWTTAETYKHWFCPKPWVTVECEIDARPGGIFRTVMRSPEGHDYPNTGCFLEVIKNERLVWTDALLPGFRPVKQPESGAGMLFSAAILLEPNGKGTKYTAISRHKDETDRLAHEKMGFQEGWGICLDQLIAFVKQK